MCPGITLNTHAARGAALHLGRLALGRALQRSHELDVVAALPPRAGYDDLGSASHNHLALPGASARHRRNVLGAREPSDAEDREYADRGPGLITGL